MKHSSNEAIVRILCPDQPGIIASVTHFVHSQGGNILDLDQHTDATHNRFYMRISWNLEHFNMPKNQIEAEFQKVLGNPYQMKWTLQFSDKPMRLALFVSRQLHCLYDMLGRWQTGEWPVEIPLIISNHDDARHAARQFGIDFHHIPITKDNKTEQEARQLALLEHKKVDLVVLARYMQILSGNFINHFKNRVINIHHSFLPAFPGARPYHSAYERGVKIIGATSHYVTEDLDDGPIIEQDIVHVTHRDNVPDLIRKGRDLETLVLSRAVYKHISHKTLIADNRTIIFN